MTAGSIATPVIIPLKVSQGPKHMIDSRTRIALSSDTPDTVIYYTLDKTRPTPSLRQPAAGSSKRSTYRYREPFTLSTGKVTIKAMACSQDLYKESSVVTKNFTVMETEDVSTDSSDDDEVEPADMVEHRSPPKPPPSISSQLRHRLSMGSRASMLSEGSETSPTNLQRTTFTGSVRSLAQASTKSIGQSTAVSVCTNVSRPATANIPSPVCLYCNCPRSKDPSHIFCTHCGSHLPPLPDVEPKPPLQVAVCSKCRAHVPLGSTLCVVCEGSVLHPSPIPVIQAQAHMDLDDKVVCLVCGTRNRSDSTHCLTCDKPLPPEPATPIPPTQTPPPLPNPTVMRPISGSSYMMCGQCGRVNVSDARFCDWCGSKPVASQLMVECASCGVPNEWHCRHCYTCGLIIKAPLRPDVELSSTMKMPASVELDKNAWIPVVELQTPPDVGPTTAIATTQTDGIFYPSARTIGSRKGSEFIKKMIHISARDRVPKLQNYSPGKGLWRMQLEHVCTHLRAYCQSSESIQSSLGKPQLGKLLSADVQGDSEKVDIHMGFELKQQKKSIWDNKSVLRRTSSCGNISSPRGSPKTTPTSQSAQTTPTKEPPTSDALKPKERHHRKKSISSHSNKNNLSGVTNKLYKELLGTGQGRKDVVNSLIQKGADVNGVSPDTGQPMLSLATSSGHLASIATLVEAGAKVDAHTKATGNTALHEAVLQGPTHMACVEALLGLGANARKRNGNGLTPCDLAMKLKHDEIVTCFAMYVGAGLLDNLYKYQPSLTL